LVLVFIFTGFGVVWVRLLLEAYSELIETLFVTGANVIGNVAGHFVGKEVRVARSIFTCTHILTNSFICDKEALHHSLLDDGGAVFELIHGFLHPHHSLHGFFVGLPSTPSLFLAPLVFPVLIPLVTVPLLVPPIFGVAPSFLSVFSGRLILVLPVSSILLPPIHLSPHLAPPSFPIINCVLFLVFGVFVFLKLIEIDIILNKLELAVKVVISNLFLEVVVLEAGELGGADEAGYHKSCNVTLHNGFCSLF